LSMLGPCQLGRLVRCHKPTQGCSCTHSMVTIGSSQVSMLKRCLAFFIMLLECQCSLSCLCSVVPQPVRELLCYCHPACGKLSFAELLIKPSMCQTAHQAMFKHVRAALHLPSHCLFSQSLLPLAVITIDICNPYKKRRRPAILSLTDATFHLHCRTARRRQLPS